MEAGTAPRAAPSGVSGNPSPRVLRVASDTHLVALVRDGRAAAFEALYDRHSRAILSFCRHMLGSVEEAEDAVQHTFLAAYNDLISSHKPIQLRPWLFTIARNRCYSVLRARRERPLEELDEPVTEGLAVQVQRRQDLRDLVGDLRRLPDEQRAALVLSEMDALSHEQIGDVLGVPKDKVKALVFQARESLVASRAARETSCTEIREQIANLRGGALRRANLRRHLRECAGCREFRTQINHQRRMLRVLLPVVPAIGLKETVLGATVGGGTGASFGGGLLAGGLFKTGALKGIVAAMIAGIGAAGTYVVVRDIAMPASPFSGLPKLVQRAPFTPAPAAATSSSGSASSALFSTRLGRARGGRGYTFVELTTGGVALRRSGAGRGGSAPRAVGHSLSRYGRSASAPHYVTTHTTPPASSSPAPAPAPATGATISNPVLRFPDPPSSHVSASRHGSSGSGSTPSSGNTSSGSGSSGTTTTYGAVGSHGSSGSGSGSSGSGSGQGNTGASPSSSGSGSGSGSGQGNTGGSPSGSGSGSGSGGGGGSGSGHHGH
jgi:RNA polymerase sigma factor (sigma-70 family)